MTTERKWIGFKDIILISLLSALCIVIQIVAGIPFAATPQLMMFVCVGVIMLVCGPIYVLLMSKAPRRGAAFLFVGVLALYFLILGQVMIAAAFLLGAVLCELVMLGDGYHKPMRIGLAYMIFGAFYVVGSYLPYLILADQYVAQLTAMGMPQSTVDNMMGWFASPSMIALACLNACVWAAVGAYVGYRMRKKHFAPAGVV